MGVGAPGNNRRVTNDDGGEDQFNSGRPPAIRELVAASLSRFAERYLLGRQLRGKTRGLARKSVHIREWEIAIVAGTHFSYGVDSFLLRLIIGTRQHLPHQA